MKEKHGGEPMDTGEPDEETKEKHVEDTRAYSVKDLDSNPSQIDDADGRQPSAPKREQGTDGEVHSTPNEGPHRSSPESGKPKAGTLPSTDCFSDGFKGIFANLAQGCLRPDLGHKDVLANMPETIKYKAPAYFLLGIAMLKPTITIGFLGLPTTEDGGVFNEGFWKTIKKQGPPFVYLALAVVAVYTDFDNVVKAMKDPGANFGERLGMALITLASSGNIGSYLAAGLVYCCHTSKSDGEAFLSYVFGESACAPCFKQQLALVWMIFGVPKCLDMQVVRMMPFGSQVLFVMLHMLYLPILRGLSLVAFGVGWLYAWFFLPLVFLLCSAMLILANVLASIIYKLYVDPTMQNKMAKTVRWSLVGPVLIAPMLPVALAIGVRFMCGDGYMNSFYDTMLHPSLSEWFGHHVDKIQDQVVDNVNTVYTIV